MRGFRIGRVFGIDVRIDWSWVFVVLLLTWNLEVVFSRWHPDWSAPGQLGVALAGVLIFWGCILLHELAHAFVAKRNGVAVHGITLFLFGGVSNIEHDPRSAGVELAMALAGPLVSIVLGVAFLLLGSATVGPVLVTGTGEDEWTALASVGPLATLLIWLGPVNLFIGLFNLIPAFPLDGGRIFRALIWAVNHDYEAATKTASVVGQAIGWAFIVAGIAMTFGARLPVLGTGLVGGLWIAFIGWFVRSAALAAYARLALDEALAGHSVQELLRPGVAVVGPEVSLAELVQDFFVRSDVHGVPVVQGGTLVGLVSVSEVRAVPAADWPRLRVGDVMRPRDAVVVVGPHDSLSEAYERMVREDIEQMPVLEAERLAGMLRRRDVARWLELAWKPSSSDHRRGGTAPPFTPRAAGT
ncbi:MAG: site-2 protease family protein [Polyangiaceae bacterium]